MSESCPRRTPEDWLAAVSMMLLAVITLANVVLRYLTDRSIAWTEEISVFLLVLTTMAGASAAALRDTHIRIEFFFAGGSADRRRRLALFAAGLTCLFFLGFAMLSGRVVWDEYRYGETSMGLSVPRWWYTIWVPALSLVIAWRAAGVFMARWRR